MNKFENLVTERLTLIPADERFIEPCFNSFTPEVTEYMYPKPADDISETAAFIDASIRQRDADTDYIYAITLSENGEFCGFCGLHNLQEEVPELGIWTKMAVHGNHYGREAIGALIESAREMGIEKLIYPVDKRNIPSKKIPQFYGGKMKGRRTETSQSGKTLDIEDYFITL